VEGNFLGDGLLSGDIANFFNLAEYSFYREFSDKLAVPTHMQDMPNVAGSRKVRD
jgi:hypothetical protein